MLMINLPNSFTAVTVRH